jgi:hypothetical protein
MTSGILLGMLLCSLASAQVLPLPPRPPGATPGSALTAILSSLTRAEREDRIFHEATAGNVPDFQRNLVPVTVSSSPGGVAHTATYYVTPDYFAVGADDDYLLIPMTPLLAQRIADATRCLLPTRKMVDDIYRAAAVKLPPQPIAPSSAMTTVPVFAAHHDSVWRLRAPLLAAFPAGSLVGGTKKDVVISNKMYVDLKPGVPRPVVIYGWHRTDGTPIQPLYNGHEETYADYSHGVRLVRDSVIVNGMPSTIRRILGDPVLCVLLSDEGTILKPRYNLTLNDVRDGDQGWSPGGKSRLPLRVGQNFPNPFNPRTTIPVSLQVSDGIRVSLFDTLGREVLSVFDGVMEAGEHTIPVRADGLPAGVYFYRVAGETNVATGRMCLIP